MRDTLKLRGVFTATCYDRKGRVVWVRTFENTVVTAGINLLLDTLFRGSAYSVTGPYMGLISSVGFSAIAASDTAASHPGWLEAGLAHPPTYVGTRATMIFAAPSMGSISLVNPTSFATSGAGTIKGGFFVLGSGAVATIDSTAGTLFSAGLFTGGDAPILAFNTITVTYTLSVS